MTNKKSSKGELEEPAGSFDVIYADCPWDIQQKGGGYGAERHYDLLSLEQLKGMGKAV